MYDLDELQSKHLKDILKLKAEVARNTDKSKHTPEAVSQSQFSKFTKINQLEEELEEAKGEIIKLKEEIKKKEAEFSTSVMEFKRRESMMEQMRKTDGRRQVMSESSESESSLDDEQEGIKRKMKRNKIQNLKKEIVHNKKKVGRADLLNLPSSDDERVVRKLDNLHEPSSFEEDEEKSNEGSVMNLSDAKQKKKSPKKRKHLRSKLPKKKALRSKTINLDGDEMGMDDEIMTSLRSESVDKINKEPKSSQVRATQKRETKDNLEMKRKLEDAEYKDLKQRYHEDERDKNYVLNEREAIEEAADKESEGANELNESIDKLEEEQDLEFKDKVALISHEFMKDIKFLDEEKDANELNSLHKAMIQKVFD